MDFDLGMTEFTHVPIKNELLVQNLEDMQDRQRIKGEAIDFEGYNPKKSFWSNFVKSRKSIMRNAPLCCLS